MDEISNGPTRRVAPGWRRYGSAAALVAGGLVAGGVLASTLSATAADPTPAPSVSSSSPGTSTNPVAPRGDCDGQRGGGSGEKALTGTTASKVRAAALAKYPGANVQRVETDSDGVYEVHLITSAGQPVTVAVGKNFTVTGAETGGGRGHHGGLRPGMPAPDSRPSGSSGTSSSGGTGWFDDSGSSVNDGQSA